MGSEMTQADRSGNGTGTPQADRSGNGTSQAGRPENGAGKAIDELLTNRESCTSLWIAVIEQAVDDLAWLRNLRSRKRLSRDELDRLKVVLQNSPAGFFRSSWFVDICHDMNLCPELVREQYEIAELLDATDESAERSHV